jgi:SAM-dependent methyltransferase
MRLFRRLGRHGAIGTLKLVPLNLRYLLRSLSPAARAARRRDRGFDRRYGTRTSGIIPLGALDAAGAGVAEATCYEPTPVETFDAMMRLLPRELADFRFIDYGSGRGRALLLASRYSFKEIIGVEFSERLHRDAETNLQKFRPSERVCYNVKSLLMDALVFEPPPGPAVLFFFNPFGRELMATVLKRIEEANRGSAPPLYLLYVYPSHQDLLVASPFWAKLGGSSGNWVVFGSQRAVAAAQ